MARSISPLNDSLAYAAAKRMRLTYLDRTTYRRKTDPDLIAELHRRFGDFYLLPEGGSNMPAARGCAELPAGTGSSPSSPADLVFTP